MRFSNRKRVELGLDAALSALGPNVQATVRDSHRALSALNIPHVIVGGVAVGAWGNPYATKDVDWLVSDDAFVKHGTLVTFKSGLPIFGPGNVAIDYLSAEGFPALVAERMRRAIERSRRDPSAVFICEPEVLVFMKLHAGRPKDISAVVALIAAGGIDATDVRAFLVEVGDAVVLKRFDVCAKHAGEEE